jgi:hypothetical protein
MQSKKERGKEIFISFWSFCLSLELWAMGFSWCEKEGA